MACGARLFHTPGLQPPVDFRPVRAEPAPLQPRPAPPPLPPRDFRPHITLGFLLALVSTLVIPPLLGGVAVWLGWMAYSKGQGAQRRQGLLVIAAGVAGIVLGMVVSFWVESAKLLG